jgi:thiamine-phosphate pyrophosphorylase
LGTSPISSRPALDLTLYVILDPAEIGTQALLEAVVKAAAGGASLFQLRDKRASARETVGLARALRACLEPFGVPLLINDRVDIALASGAEGVHLGQEDMAPEDARRLLGAEAIIGLTARSRAEAEAAPLDLVDYSIGGVFPTSSKQQTTAPIGLTGLAEIAGLLGQGTRVPLCAISGIKAENAANVIRQGVCGVAVLSAVTRAPDPEAAARGLKEIVLAERDEGTRP